MGCGASSPAAGGNPPARRTEPETPDVGLSDLYDAVKFLGRGGTGDTWLFRDKRTGEDVAIKLIKRPLPKIILPNILREIRIQAELGEGHINIVDAKAALLTESHLALVMEYAAGGSLTGYVAERWQHAQHAGLFLGEDEARYFFRQFIGAVEYCHGHCVAHRDLKLDNTLLSSDSPPVLKLCDFGFAKTWTEDANMYTHIGTPVYMSPELINSNRGGAGGGTGKGYDGALADVWAAGVLLIVMLLGTFPFDHTEHPDPNTSEAHLEVWLQQVRQPWTGLPHIKAALGKLSPECTDLLNKIFVIDDKKRISVPAIKAHPWYTRSLSSKHAAAEAAVTAAQAKVAAAAAARRTNSRLVAGRTSALEKLVDAAAARAVVGPSGPATSPLVNIDLSTSAVLGAGGGEGGGGGGGGSGDGGASPPAPAPAAAGGAAGPPATGGARGSVDLAGIAEDGDEEGGGEDSRHGGQAAAAAAAKEAMAKMRAA